MRIRIFRATSLAAAMAQVRDELGLDALILSTANGNGTVEVTAALEPEDEAEPRPGSKLDLPPADRIASAVAASEPADGRDHAPAHALVRHNLPPALLAALSTTAPETGCSRLFRFGGLPLDADGPPLMLAGPPGAGKTLTVAKLATRLVMDGHRPLVITADEQRAGAVEQLAAFTRLLGLTLIAAGRPEMLARALSRREPRSPVLIDAPGLDLLDPAQDELLAALVAASGAQTALVLPAGIDALEAADVAAAHARRGTGLLVATRLGRHARLGGILAAAHGANLALTEGGTTADVVDGLIALTPAVLATHLWPPLAARDWPSSPAAAPAFPPVAIPAAAAPPPSMPGCGPGREPNRATLALHIAAQAGARAPSWKTSP